MITAATWRIISVVLSVIVLSLASVYDVRTMRLPNAVTLPGIPIGLLLCAVSCDVKETLIRSIAVAALLAVYFTGLLAGGDAKLLMTVAALNGALAMILSLLVSNVIIILYRYLRDRDGTEASLFYGWTLLTRPDRMEIVKKREGKKVPFAVYLAIGYLIVETALLLAK